MRTQGLVLIMIVLFSISGCTRENVPPDIELEEYIDENEETEEMDTVNRAMIAEALGIEKDSRNIRFILGNLNKIGAGYLQSAQVEQESGQKVLNIIAEDGTAYSIYLSGSGSVEAIKNLVTGEWPIQSTK